MNNTEVYDDDKIFNGVVPMDSNVDSVEYVQPIEEDDDDYYDLCSYID